MTKWDSSHVMVRLDANIVTKTVTGRGCAPRPD